MNIKWESISLSIIIKELKLFVVNPFFYIKKYLPFGVALILFAGLLFSRALLSVGEGAAAIYGAVFIFNTRKQYAYSLLWGFIPSVLCCLGIYQTAILKAADLDYFLTLAAYPSLLLFFLRLDDVQKKQVVACWIVAVFISLLYPLAWYVFHFKETVSRYEHGQTLPVLMNDDHVRYGIFISSGLIPLLHRSFFRKKTKILLATIIALAIVFLSVRTAWVALFILLLVYLPGFFKWQRSVAALFVFAAFVLLAYKMIPTVNQKVNYTIYDWQHYDAQKYLPDFSDGTRRSVNTVAWQAITHYHKTNIGWNKVPVVLQEVFRQQYPEASLKYGWPFNQFLFWWMGAGLLGCLLFSLWLFSPALFFFKEKNKAAFGWTLVIAASCMVECTLNMQYGVFLHAWAMAYAFSESNKTKSSV